MKKECKCCKGQNIGLSWDYDARYCKVCFVWLEPQCLDETCDFCANRPPTAKDECSE